MRGITQALQLLHTVQKRPVKLDYMLKGPRGGWMTGAYLMRFGSQSADITDLHSGGCG